MAALVLLGSPQVHDPQGGADGPLTRGEDRACEQHLGVAPNTLGKKSSANGARSCTIAVGRVCIALPLLVNWQRAYPTDPSLPKWVKSS
jgi:hypothetical protein